MMSFTYHTVLQSGMDQFFVGKSRKQFSVHRGLKSSFPSRALEPEMIEWVDEEVFGCCCEFVYSRDYSTPSPIPESSGNDGSQPKVAKSHYQKTKRWDPSSLTWNLFYPSVCSLNYDILHKLLGHTPQSKLEKHFNNDPSTSYAAVFLSHARVHRFGVRTGWLSLIGLSTYKLLQLLENFALFEERTGDIVQLLEFVFEDNEDMEEMRLLEDMLRDYMVWNVDTMVQNVAFKNFLGRNPSIEQTIFRSMWD